VARLPKLPAIFGRLPQLPPRVRKVVRYVGIVLGTLLAFVFALQLTFPYGRVKDRLEEALSEKFIVTIGSYERGWIPGRVYFHDIDLQGRPSQPNEPTTTIHIKTLEIDVHFLPLLGKKLAVDIDAKIGGGRLSASIAMLDFGQSGYRASFDGTDLPAAIVPLRDSVGLPMTGTFDASGSLDIPIEAGSDGRRYLALAHVDGAIDLGCPRSCTFGDGKSKMKPILSGANAKNQAMVGEGVNFEKITAQNLVARVEIKDGKLSVTKADLTSNDLIGFLDFQIALDKKSDVHLPVMQQLGEADVTGCARFKPSDTLDKHGYTYAALMNTGAERRADGLFHIKLTGKWKMLQKLNAECGGAAQNNAPPPGGPVRPNLVVHPDEPPRPPPAVVPPPQPPAPPPTTTPPPPTMAGSAAQPPPTPAPGATATMIHPPGPEGEAAGSAGSGGSAGSAIMN
jgi:type II secretion system protein N